MEGKQSFIILRALKNHRALEWIEPRPSFRNCTYAWPPKRRRAGPDVELFTILNAIDYPPVRRLSRNYSALDSARGKLKPFVADFASTQKHRTPSCLTFAAIINESVKGTINFPFRWWCERGILDAWIMLMKGFNFATVKSKLIRVRLNYASIASLMGELAGWQWGWRLLLCSHIVL